MGTGGPVLLALLACGVCCLGGWRGTDWAAQVYRASQASRWGLAVWDPGWYGGTYPLNYSLLYPLVAGYLGLWPVAALSSAGAAFSFDRLVVRQFGERPLGSWYFALSSFVQVAIGQLPTLAGEALALGSLLCLAQYRDAQYPAAGHPGTRYRHHPDAWPARAQLVTGLVLGALAGLTSPVVGSFLTLALVAWGLADLGRVAPRQVFVEMSAVAVVLASTAALPLVFPGPGYFPFGFGDLVVVLAICALLASPAMQVPRPVRAGAILYAAVSAGLFVFQTPLGDNDTRLAAYVGVPLAVCYLPRLARRLGLGQTGRLRSLGAAVVLSAIAASLVVWHWSPALEALDGATSGPSSTAAYYEPLIDELNLMSKGRPVRVEIPPTTHHWESAYVAPTFSLARGWERQLDIAYDALFYRSEPLSPTEYRAWLLSNGVSFVALPDAPLDFAATAEARLLRSGEVKGLQAVWHTASWQLWRVLGSQGLASAPATVVSLNPRSVDVRFSRPGTSTLELRWSPYWSLAAAAKRQACLSRAPGGWTELNSDVAGQLRLSMSVLHPDHGNCPAPGGLRSGVNGR